MIRFFINNQIVYHLCFKCFQNNVDLFLLTSGIQQQISISMSLSSILLLFGALIAFIQGQSYASSYVISQYRFFDGGYTSTFSFNPTFISRLTTNSFVLYVATSTNTVFNLARGLYLNDQSLHPIGGFSCSYSLSGLPSWAQYDSATAMITVNSPSSFSTINFTISYTDVRNNSNSIPASFVNPTYVGNNNLGYRTPLNYRVSSSQSQASAANIYTLVFPLFTTSNTSLSSARANNYGSVTNIGVRPWYNLIPVEQTSESDWNNITSSLGFLIINVTGTYVNGVLVSSTGYFTNSTGTYFNGAYQGNSGFITNSSGTYLNGIYLGAPGYVISGTQVYYAGVLVTPGSSTGNTGYIVVNATGTFVNGVLVSSTGYFTNSSGTYYNGNFQGSSGFVTNASGTYYNGNYVGAAGYVVINGQAYYGGVLVTYSPNAGYLVVNATGTYVNGLLISNTGYFTNLTGTYLNGVYQGNVGFTTNSSGTYFNGILVGSPGYVIVGNQVYYGGILISSSTSASLLTSLTSGTYTNPTYTGSLVTSTSTTTTTTGSGTGTLFTPNATITSG